MSDDFRGAGAAGGACPSSDTFKNLRAMAASFQIASGSNLATLVLK